MPEPGIPAIPTDIWTRAAALPWVVHVLGGFLVLWIVVQAAPGLTGKYRATVEGWTDARRRAKTVAKDADIAALEAKVDNLSAMFAQEQKDSQSLRIYQDNHEKILSIHAVWDRAMIASAIELGGTPPPKPPLFPDSPCPESGDGQPEDITRS